MAKNPKMIKDEFWDEKKKNDYENNRFRNT